MLQNLFTWKGCIGRMQYFGYSFIAAAISALAWIPLFIELARLDEQGGDPSIVTMLLGAAGMLVAAFIGIVTTIKRLHDLNRSGWWQVPAMLVPSPLASSSSSALQVAAGLFSIGWCLYLTFASGTSGENRFGPAQARPEKVAKPKQASSDHSSSNYSSDYYSDYSPSSAD